MDTEYGNPSFKFINKPSKVEHVKPGDKVIYNNTTYKVIRVDRHVYPVVLEEVGRVSLNDIRCHNE